MKAIMMRSIAAGTTWVSVLAAILAPFETSLAAGSGQTEGTKAPRELVPVFTPDSITIDGVMEDAWAKAAPSSGFIQKNPEVGVPATEQTEIRVLYNQSSIYLAIHCYDSDPSGIIAKERRRDDPLLNDDSISILLDTFHD